MDNYKVGLEGYAPAVGTIFETNGERGTRCEFTMELGLGSACADRAPGHHWVKFSKKEEVEERGLGTYYQPHTVVKWYQGARNQRECQGL